MRAMSGRTKYRRGNPTSWTAKDNLADAGYLRDLSWPHGGSIDISQGVDMGMPSKLKVTISEEPGSPVLVSGASRKIS